MAVVNFRNRPFLVDSACPSYKPYAKAIDPIVKKLLKCSIERIEKGVKLVGEDGSFIPLEVAHLEIQLDRDSQHIIYGAAMSHWR